MGNVKRAALLVRISDDKAEDAQGVARQEKDCRALAKRLGWPVAEVYVENDTSAYKRRMVQLPDGSTGLRTVRPELRRLLGDLAGGAVDALIGYDLDRVARDPRDIEDLIDVVEARHIPNRSVTGSLDLSSDAGITMARVMVAVANKSSRDTARRVTRKQQELAEQGRPTGGGIRAYGYDSDGLTVREDEAAVIRRIAEQVLDGVPLQSITNKLSADGIPTVRGAVDAETGQLRGWNRRSVHAVVTKPRVAGLREYRGEIVGEAAWPAILDRDTWERVRAALQSRTEGHTNQLRRWLTGTLLCGKCGHTLAGSGQAYGRGPRYWCNPQKGGCGGIGVDATGAELLVEGWLLGYLSKSENLAGLQAETAASNVAELRADIRDDQAQLQELAGLWAAKSITTAEYMAARGAIESRMRGHQQLVKQALPGGVRTLLDADDLRAAWQDLVPARRREACEIVFPRGVTVAPSTGDRFKGFEPGRLAPVDWPVPA